MTDQPQSTDTMSVQLAVRSRVEPAWRTWWYLLRCFFEDCAEISHREDQR